MKDMSIYLDTLDRAKTPEDRAQVMAKMLAIAWSQGYACCYDDGGEALNPYRDAEETAARERMGL